MAAGSEHRFVQQLKRGVLEMLVLQLLADRPGHGYELIVRLRESGGLLDVKEGTLYPILYRLEEEGCITSVWNSPDGPDAPARLPGAFTPSPRTGGRCWPASAPSGSGSRVRWNSI